MRIRRLSLCRVWGNQRATAGKIVETMSEIYITGQIRVLLADDHQVVRVGIKRLLSRARDIEVVGETSNGADALRLVHDLAPDVLLLDMEMPGMSGLEVARKLKEEKSSVRVLVLSGYEDRQYIQSVLAAGAYGYITKGDHPESITHAIRQVALGMSGLFSPRIRDKVPV